MADTRYWNDNVARQALSDKGRAVYERIRGELTDQQGVVAIEPESGAYFVGPTLGEANDAAYKEYPDQWVYFVWIDDPTADIALPTW